MYFTIYQMVITKILYKKFFTVIIVKLEYLMGTLLSYIIIAILKCV